MSDENSKPVESSQPDELALWRERLLLAVQGIGVSLDRIANAQTKQDNEQ